MTKVMFGSETGALVTARGRVSQESHCSCILVNQGRLSNTSGWAVAPRSRDDGTALECFARLTLPVPLGKCALAAWKSPTMVAAAPFPCNAFASLSTLDVIQILLPFPAAPLRLG